MRQRDSPYSTGSRSEMRVHYIKDGNDMIVDKVIYTDNH